VRRRSIALSVIAITLASAALAAQNAAALPEIGRCVAQAGTGRYKDANCTQKAGGSAAEKQFEFKKGAAKKAFTEAGGETLIEGASGTKFICQAESGSGEYHEVLGAIKGVQKLVIRFTNCATPALGVFCASRGAQSGEFVTSQLKGTLGYISGEKTKLPVAGQRLQPEKAKGPFLEFQCSGGAITVKIGVRATTPNGNDCVIGSISPPNLMSTTFDQAFGGSEGNQSPQSFRATPTKICNLEASANGGAFEPTDLDFSSTLANEEELEIKA
jgi:hypothetical protein